MISPVQSNGCDRGCNPDPVFNVGFGNHRLYPGENCLLPVEQDRSCGRSRVRPVNDRQQEVFPR